VAAPLSQAKKVTMVSSGKGDVGASKLTGEVFDIMERLPLVVQGMTGVDISKVGNDPGGETAPTLDIRAGKLKNLQALVKSYQAWQLHLISRGVRGNSTPQFFLFIFLKVAIWRTVRLYLIL
jgi:hypothetical protein